MSRYSMPGSWTSSTYVPLPRMKRGSSFRLIECPIPPTSGEVLSAITCLPRSFHRFPELGRRMLHGLDDVHVAGAPAEVAGDAAANVIVGRRLVLSEERIAGHEHPRRAVAALQPVLGHEAFLERVEPAVLLEAFHRHDLFAPGLDREHRARLHGSAIEDDGAGSAVRRVAADVSAGEPEDVADQVDEQEARLDVGLVLLAVDGDLDLHRAHPSQRTRATRSSARWSARAVRKIGRAHV